MHIILAVTLIFAQTLQEPSQNFFKEFGLPGLLVLLMVGMFKYFIWDADKKNATRETEIFKQNEVREKALLQQGDEMRRLIERVSADWRETNYKLDRNYQEAINKFIEVIKNQGDQNNYTTQVLVELKDKVEEIAKKNYLSRSELQEFKKEIIELMQRIGVEYNLTAKARG